MKSKKKKLFLQLTRKEFAVWISLIFFVFLWMFVLGVLVGRELFPVRFDIKKIQKELAARKEADIKKKRSALNTGFDIVDKDRSDKEQPELGFYEALKGSENKDRLRADKLKQKAGHLAKAPEKAVPKKAVSKKATSKVGVVNRPEKNKIAAVDKKVESDKKITIQVASLKDLKTADSLVEKLKKKGYFAYRTIGKVSGKGIWHRVRIGYFKNRAEAAKTLSRLKEDKLEAFIVTR